MKKTQLKKAMKIPGFRFAGVSSGIKSSGKKDLALILSETNAETAGVFTTNRIKAAPVLLNMSRLRKKKKGRAILINSGNANACTGQQGLLDAREAARCTARELGISPDSVYVSSTGIIGKPLPMQKIRNALPDAIGSLSPHGLADAASAIMTTDTFPKIVFQEIPLGTKKGIIAGIAKGAGMICPSMATMLSFLVTDVAVEPAALSGLLKEAVNTSFNRLTVDNDMSTNDTVLIMANGLLGNKPIGNRSPHYRAFRKALEEVTRGLSRQIALDGEGGTKLIEVVVTRARTVAEAERVGRAIAQSLLVKTAVHGRSLNWGRIMAAIGYSGAKIQEKKITISLNGRVIVKNGMGAGSGTHQKGLLAKKTIVIVVSLGQGNKEATMLTCDLSEKYIRINADYMS